MDKYKQLKSHQFYGSGLYDPVQSRIKTIPYIHKIYGADILDLLTEETKAFFDYSIMVFFNISNDMNYGSELDKMGVLAQLCHDTDFVWTVMDDEIYQIYFETLNLPDNQYIPILNVMFKKKHCTTPRI